MLYSYTQPDGESGTVTNVLCYLLPDCGGKPLANVLGALMLALLRRFLGTGGGEYSPTLEDILLILENLKNPNLPDN